MLAQALENGGVPPGQPAQGQQFRDPRVDEILARQETERQQYQQQQRQNLERSYAKFAQEHEFFEDVRALMATIVTVKHEQEGVDISDEEAYTMAVALRPDLTEVLKQREALAQATSPGGPTARARAAAVSLKPGSIATRKAADPDDLNAILHEAAEEHGIK
jgi:ribosomal protein L12E/L44/L45/RPP1/RPP2